MGKAVAVAVAVSASCLLGPGGCGSGGNETIDARSSYDAGFDAPAPDANLPDAQFTTIPEELPDPLPTGDPDVHLVTFNTALALTIKYGEQREPVIIDAINGFDADVICLQEVWNHFSGKEAVADALRAQWPYIFFSYINTTTWGNGVMILSKHPLYRGRHLRFEHNDSSGVIDRIVIGADVVTDTSHFHVLCTHLALDIDIRNDEIAELKTWAQAEGYYDAPTFLLGDFNTGPKTSPSICDPCNPVDTTGYDAVREDFTDPNEGWDQCTLCRAISNPMQVIEPDPNNADKRIDHCFFRGIGTSTMQASSIVLDQEISLDTPSDGVVQTHYSDHVGLSCTFAP